jgi:hypothetical protein
MISLRIDVKKISKDRLYQGEKGTYLDAVLIETPDSDYGDYMIVESITKDEREQGKKGVILGNAKIYGKKKDSPEPPDDLPF